MSAEHNGGNRIPYADGNEAINQVLWGIENYIVVVATIGLIFSSIYFYRGSIFFASILFFLSMLLGISPFVAQVFYY